MPAEGFNDWPAVLGRMRPDSRESALLWYAKHARHEGGLLVLRASFKGRDLIEAAFATEHWPLAAN